jgi:UDP-N-acetylmuramate--alanine ligase
MSYRASQPHTHLMGVGGIGMSALAQVLLACGERLSGCDLHASALTAKLERLGLAFSEGHHPEHLAGADRLIISDAIARDHPELAHARAAGLPVLRRSQVVGELMRCHRGLAVAGTHGKTTTTAMIGLILADAGRDPTVLIGGELPQFGGNARVGGGELLVAEACEAYESFLDLEPEIAVITNIEAEHLDHHHSERAVLDSFARFLARVRAGGSVIVCADDANAAAVVSRAKVAAAGLDVVTYGLDGGGDFRAEEVRDEGMGMRFTLAHPAGRTAVRLAVPGAHNVANAVGAMAACTVVAVSAEQAAATLASFGGVERRFQAVTTAGVTVVDDYAHHPTEIRAVVAAARARCDGKLVIVFQPHLYTRTRDFLADFADALSAAELIVVTDVYAAREQPLPGVSGETMVEAVRARGQEDAFFWPQKEQVAEGLVERLEAGDWVLVLGAGDIGSVARDLAARLRRRGAAPSGPGGTACRD